MRKTYPRAGNSSEWPHDPAERRKAKAKGTPLWNQASVQGGETRGAQLRVREWERLTYEKRCTWQGTCNYTGERDGLEKCSPNNRGEKAVRKADACNVSFLLSLFLFFFLSANAILFRSQTDHCLSWQHQTHKRQISNGVCFLLICKCAIVCTSNLNNSWICLYNSWAPSLIYSGRQKICFPVQKECMLSSTWMWHVIVFAVIYCILY